MMMLDENTIMGISFCAGAALYYLIRRLTKKSDGIEKPNQTGRRLK